MKNGKLFGKLNVIDLLIILIVLVGLVFLAVRFLGKEEVSEYTAPQPVRLTFFAPDAPALLDGKLEIGAPVTDYDESLGLGTLSGISTEEAYAWQYDSINGEAVRIPVANQIRLTFSCDVDGYPGDDGLRVGGHRYCIGGSYTICAGRARVFCRLANFEVIG